jgi:hypothetical protein
VETVNGEVSEQHHAGTSWRWPKPTIPNTIRTCRAPGSISRRRKFQRTYKHWLVHPPIPQSIQYQKLTHSSRHELAEQTNPQLTQQISHYTALSFPPFSIATDTDSLSSGFPFTPRLSQLRITRDQWHQFSLEVVNAAKLTFSEDAAAWAAGVGTGVGSSAFLLVFGPVVGYYTGKSIHKKTVAKKVKEKLAQDGELRNVIRRWNEGSFRERGVQVWMEAPSETVGRFRIVVSPWDPRSAPLSRQEVQMSPVSPSSGSQVQWGQSPVQYTQGQGWGGNQMPMKPPVQQVQGGWGNQQPIGNDGKPVMMAQELPVPVAAPFIAELDGVTAQSAPEIPPKLPPKAS